LNPVPGDEWTHTRSVQMINQLVESNMFPLTLHGLEDAMGHLSR